MSKWANPVLVANVVLIVLVFIAVVHAQRPPELDPTGAAYLRAIPKSDAERRDAADLALKGLVICVLGLFFAPIALPGVVLLFYGGRKLVYAMLGLGLIDDGIGPRG